MNLDYQLKCQSRKVMLAFEKDEFNLTFVLDAYQRIKDVIKLSNNKKHFNFIKGLYESFDIKFYD